MLHSPLGLPPPPQGELQLLCMQLDRHISAQIRESPQATHHTMLKDLATQTYIRWQELLTHCQPQVVPPQPPDLGGAGSGQAELARATSTATLAAAAELLAGTWVEQACGGRVGTP